MAKKLSKADLLMLQIREAAKIASQQCDQSNDFGRGEYAGVHNVLVQLYQIQRRDAALALEGIERGSI